MSQDTKFIQEYREKFNIDVLYIVNIINKIFNVQKNIKNYIEVGEDKIPNPLHNNLTYDNLKSTSSSSLEKEMFDRVCQNIASIYASPINPPKNINLDDLPLTSDSSASKPVGVMVGDLTEYVYDKETKRIVKKEKKDVQEKICNTDELNELKNYFFLKLKLLVYLRSVLNLNNDETTTNQWEKIFLDAVKSNYNKNKIEEAGYQLKVWYDYIKRIFDDIKTDQIDIPQLKQYLKAFEMEDTTTKNLCESIIQICDNNKPSKSLIQNTCNQQINVHSVTTDICYKEAKEVLNETKKLDQKISEELSKRKDASEIQNIQTNLNELNQQQKNLVINPKDPKTLESARKINEVKASLLDQLQIIPEKNPTPLKRSATLTDLKPTSDKTRFGVISSNPVQGGQQKVLPQVVSQDPRYAAVLPVVIPSNLKQIGDATSNVNAAIQRLVEISRITNKPQINKVLEEVNTNTKLYEQQSKINPDKAKENWIRSVSQTLVNSGQTADPVIQKVAALPPVANILEPDLPALVTAPLPAPLPAPVPAVLPVLLPSQQRSTVCLGQNTLLDELKGLIDTINDDEDKKLLAEIKEGYIQLVENKISKIKNKYISPSSFKK